MSSISVEEKISTFLKRKAVDELALSGRNESRTAKYAQTLRSSGQMLFTR